MSAPGRLTVNGEVHALPPCGPRTRLLDVLRDLGLQSPREGCGEGECGACAVMCVRRDAAGRARYESVASCLVLAPSLPDLELWTAEGLAREGELHPVQQAMVKLGGSQCGYCTPGFVMSMAAEYYRPERQPHELDVEAIGGNLCRCTGYRPIRDALSSLGAPTTEDPLRARLDQPVPAPAAWSGEHVGFTLHRPRELGEVLALLQQYPRARLVHGATDVAVEVHHGLSRPPHLVSLEAVQALRVCEVGDEHIRIGAGLPLEEVGERLAGAVPLLDQLLPLFSSRLIRRRATFGGNLGTASPIGDGSLALLALDAEVELCGDQGIRWLPLSDFFVGYRQTRRAASEVIVSLRLPRAQPAVARFYKVAKRNRDDISIVAAAFALDLEDGHVCRARLAFGGVAATPLRALDAERALVGQPWPGPTLTAVHAALGGVQPLSDHRGSASYRAALMVELLNKLCHEAAP